MSTKDKTTAEKAKERTETLQKYVSDMMAVEEHIGSAVKRQAKDEHVNRHSPQASRLINNIAQATERHEQVLKQHLHYLGGDAAKGIKEVATAALGTLAGLYDKVRTEPVSKMLRDDYTALNLATMGYTMLHTTGLALNDQATAELALRHLHEYTTIVMEINQIIPSVVVAELRDDGGVINESVVQDAVANTQRVWQPSSNGGGAGNNNGTSTPTSKRASISRKRTSNESASLADSETGTANASKTSSASRKRSSASTGSSASGSAATTTTRKRSSAASSSPSASKTSTTPKKSSPASKRSAGGSKTASS